MSTAAMSTCFYCYSQIMISSRAMWLAHGTLAHPSCAWAVEDRFWLERDEMGAKEK